MSIFYQALTSTPFDDVHTTTSEEQQEVETTIQSLLLPYQQSPLKPSSSSSPSKSPSSTSIATASSLPVPDLNKAQHIAFLRRVLDPLPAPYVGFDSTRCWLIYWVAHSYYLLGEDLPGSLRNQAISTLLHFQDKKNGGFGSGQGQIGHLMATYATIMALTILGGPGQCPDEEDLKSTIPVVGKGGWDDIDRPLLYRFLMSLKQPDGSFTVHREGEVDIRATYCVTCISVILGIATPELFEGVGEAVARCQTFEGGLSAASIAQNQEDHKGTSLGEAHGGYAYCALATHLSLSLLPNPQSPTNSPFADQPSSQSGSATTDWSQSRSASSSNMSVDDALRWAVSQQGIPIEGGGFRGRTNKLVDGCYGWFSGGGMFTVLSALVELQQGQWWKEEEPNPVLNGRNSSDKESNGASDDWESVEEDSLLQFESDGSLFDRLALQEYILVVAQHPKGGLRDKPGKVADAYHTCYNLSGLSMCQHRVQIDAKSRSRFHSKFKDSTNDGNLTDWKRNCYSSMLGWTIDTKLQCVLGGDHNRVAVTHPIFNVGFTKVKEMLDWSYNQL